MTHRLLVSVLALTIAALAVPTAALAAEGVARSTTSLRAGPSSDYPRVARVAGGERVEIFGCLARGSWCDVATAGDRGWMPGSRIDFLKDGRRTHLSSRFLDLGLAILSFGQSDYWGNHYAGRPFVNDRRWQRKPLAPLSDPVPDQITPPQAQNQKRTNPLCQLLPQPGAVGLGNCDAGPNARKAAETPHPRPNDGRLMLPIPVPHG